ncbi:hypothetical protein POM88_024504 [Heracleum sosnowskyi]|uniref:Uncharacterized protein n=1 Tax=Heracleum sosnowskyi TaxID=360622 RepID=A0AAD8MIY6_9APIA|nr:hypothetical protein POM88_024504 [Heracleum sosnowskyi]
MHLAEVGAQNRKKVVTLHSAGARSFQEVEKILTDEKHGVPPTRLEVWDRSHTKVLDDISDEEGDVTDISESDDEGDVAGATEGAGADAGATDDAEGDVEGEDSDTKGEDGESDGESEAEKGEGSAGEEED